MRLFSKMLTRKPTEEEALGKIDFDADDDAPRRAAADDTGEINPSRVRSSRAQSKTDDPFDAVSSEPITPRDEEPEEAEGAGWGANAFSDDDWDDDDDWQWRKRSLAARQLLQVGLLWHPRPVRSRPKSAPSARNRRGGPGPTKADSVAARSPEAASAARSKRPKTG